MNFLKIHIRHLITIFISIFFIFSALFLLKKGGIVFLFFNGYINVFFVYILFYLFFFLFSRFFSIRLIFFNIFIVLFTLLNLGFFYFIYKVANNLVFETEIFVFFDILQINRYFSDFKLFELANFYVKLNNLDLSEKEIQDSTIGLDNVKSMIKSINDLYDTKKNKYLMVENRLSDKEINVLATIGLGILACLGIYLYFFYGGASAVPTTATDIVGPEAGIAINSVAEQAAQNLPIYQGWNFPPYEAGRITVQFSAATEERTVTDNTSSSPSSSKKEDDGDLNQSSNSSSVDSSNITQKKNPSSFFFNPSLPQKPGIVNRFGIPTNLDSFIPKNPDVESGVDSDFDDPFKVMLDVIKEAHRRKFNDSTSKEEEVVISEEILNDMVKLHEILEKLDIDPLTLINKSEKTNDDTKN